MCAKLKLGCFEIERNEGRRENPAEGDQLDNAVSQLPLRSVVVRVDVGVHVDVVNLVVNVASVVLAVLDQGH